MILRPLSASRLRILSFGAALAAVAAVGVVASSAAPRNVARNATGLPAPEEAPVPAPPSVTLDTTYAFSSPAPTTGVNTDGVEPSTLIPDGTGNFLGAADNSGPTGDGTIFKTGPDGSFSVLHAFASATDGSLPTANLTADGQGNFYGTASQGGPTSGGVVYKLAADGTFSVVHAFVQGGEGGDVNGTFPRSPLVADGAGNLFGAAYLGGTNGLGAVYRIDSTGAFAKLHDFAGTDGSSPIGGLVADGTGGFLGVAAEGGTFGNGTIYRITPTGAFTLLYSFSATGSSTNNDGVSPDSALVTDGQGNFYGVAPFGGVNARGAIFKFTTDGTLTGSVLTPLYSFPRTAYNSNTGQSTNTDGANPEAALVYGLDGNLYGTAQNGGATGNGTVFEITPDGTYTLLHTFDGVTDGVNPVTSLTQVSTTDFYGTTAQATILFGAPVRPAGVPAGTSTANGTVFHLNVVPAAGVLQFDTVGNAIENSSPATIQVARVNGSTGAISVPFNTMDGTAKAGTDYTAVSGTLVWEDGDTADKTISVPIIDRGLSGGSTYLNVVLGKPTGGAVLAGASDTALAFRLNITQSDAPVITSALTASGQAGVAFAYQIAATGSPTSYAASGLPDGLTLDTKTGLISGVPSRAATFTSVISALNPNGTASVTVRFVISVATISTPVITSAASASASVGASFIYQITASNAPTSFGTSALPDGLTVNITTGLISGTPTTAGSYTVRLFAANAGGTGVGTLQLAVTTAQSQPTLAITSPPDGITVVVGSPVPLAASINDTDSTITSVQFLVNGAVVGTSTASGPFTAIATAPAAGIYALQAIATDAAGRTFSGIVHVTVIDADPANPAPTVNLLTPINTRDIAANTVLTITASADTAGAAGLDHVNILVDGQIIASFDAVGNLITSAHGGGPARPVRQDASGTPLSKLFTTTYQMPGLDKLLTMIVAATDKLGHTSISSVSSFHSKVTTDRAPLVSFSNASTLSKILVGSLTPVNITAHDPDSTTNSAVGKGPVRQDGASDAILAQLEYWINGVNIAKVSTSTLSYSFTPPAIGKYVFHAVATDGSGLATVSDPIIVEVDPAPPVVSVVVSGDGMAVEGGENGKVAVRRTGDLSAALSVRYKVAGSAKAGTDYKAGPVTGTAVIPAGAAQVKVKIKPVDDLLHEGTRVAKVKLLPSLDASYTLGTTSIVAKVKIIDND